MMLNFFFSSRRRHTRYWRDWSSDVCSSDLSIGLFLISLELVMMVIILLFVPRQIVGICFLGFAIGEIGRASCRERSVDLGGRRIIKKKKITNRRNVIDRIDTTIREILMRL